ncbi:MAG: hypothetical protein IJK01_06735 [Clostridia bacterium]|nr:hypothetical protein [Clostridia bacterium]
METNLTVIQEDLRAKSKSTLVLGILSQVIPTVLFVLFYIAAMVGQFAAVRHRATELEQLMPMLLLLMGGFLIAGIVMTVLGGIAWNKARAIWREAKANALRKPPMSIPGFILGLSSFVSGLIVSIIFLIYTVVIAALPSLIQFAGYR